MATKVRSRDDGIEAVFTEAPFDPMSPRTEGRLWDSIAIQYDPTCWRVDVKQDDDGRVSVKFMRRNRDLRDASADQLADILGGE